MDFRILGQLEVVTDGRPVVVSMPKVRTLLAALLLRPDRTVGTDELVDRLWDGDPPRTPRPTLQTYVRRLRMTIGDPRRIVTATHGYQIAIQPHELDLHRFRSLVDQSRRQRDPADESRLLADALGLWRGNALADVQSDLIHSVDVPILAAERLAALERRFDIELTLGRHAGLVRELQPATTEYPLRERLHGQLMLALYRSGRQADAFAVYDNIRHTLAVELGVEPDEELRTIRQHILTNDPGIAAPPARDPGVTVQRIPIPRELPPDLGDFVGRDDTRARMCDELATESGPGLAVLVGPPGVGKTALAVKVAHELRGYFSDGQLYADMRGYSTAPERTAGEVLARFLVSLGTPTAQIPSDLDALAALFRSRLADRRVLVVLDNVANPAQVRPVLPGTPDCAVIVTSRNELLGLTARQGARPISLDVLPVDQSCALLSNISGRSADRSLLVELADLCGHLPLALRIAAANLLARHDLPLADYIAELRANRLSGLEIDGDDEAAVRAAFGLSYRTLDDRAARVFRLLGLVPGQDFTSAAVAALAALPVADAGHVLDQLVTGNLALRTSGQRYQLHDLLRLYATELSARHDTDTAAAAKARLFGFYVHTVAAAADQVFPIYQLLPKPEMDPVVSPLRFADTAAATAWLERECLNAFDVLAAAVADGRPEFAWPIAESTRAYLVTSGRYRAEAVSACTTALRAAVAAGDRSAEGGVLYSLGSIHLHHGDARVAAQRFVEAVGVYEEIGDLFGQVRARIILSRAYGAAGRQALAADQIRNALELGGTNIDPAMVLHGWVNLSHVEMLRGELTAAEQAATAAWGLIEHDKSGLYKGSLHEISGLVLIRRGRCAEAIEEFGQMMTCFRQMPVPSYETLGHAALSVAYRETGDLTKALHHAESAMRLAATDQMYESDIEALLVLAEAQRMLGHHDEAGTHYRKALNLCGRLDHSPREAAVLLGYAESNRAQGNLVAATELATQAQAVAEQGGYQAYHAQAMTVAAKTHLDRGDPNQARSFAQQAVQTCDRLSARLDEARARYVLGMAQQAANEPDQARQSWQAADRALTDTNLPPTAEIRRLLATALDTH